MLMLWTVEVFAQMPNPPSLRRGHGLIDQKSLSSREYVISFFEPFIDIAKWLAQRMLLQTL